MNSAPTKMVRPASFGWRWGSLAHAIAPASALRSIADSKSKGGKLDQCLVIMSFESPLATRVLNFLERSPSDVIQGVEGLLPISYAGRLNEAIVACVARAPSSFSAAEAAVAMAAHVSKPYIRRSIQRLLSVDHVAHSVSEMLSHPVLAEMCAQYCNFLQSASVEKQRNHLQYGGPRIRCLSWPPESQKSLIRELEIAGAPLGASVGNFSHLLCVVIVRYSKSSTTSSSVFDDSLVFFGILPFDHLPLGPSPDEAISIESQSASQFADEGSVFIPPSICPKTFTGSHSRAQYKMHEAIDALRDCTPAEYLPDSGNMLDALHCCVGGTSRCMTNWRAIDVGAAPGGWTAFLAGPEVGCSKVMAVDAANLSPAVTAITTVCHIQSSLQDALISGTLLSDAPYDLLVADLNADPRDCARWLSPIFPLMKPGSALILTMKLPYATVESEFTQGQPIIEAAAEMLSFGWTSFHCRWLMANTVNERTLFAFRRAVPLGPPPSAECGREHLFNVRRSHQYRKNRALQRQAAVPH